MSSVCHSGVLSVQLQSMLDMNITCCLVSVLQVVAVKQLDRNGLQGNREFLVEVLMLSLLHHPNLMNLIGYCADGDQRLLVYEFMSLGSLEAHLHGNNRPLPSDEIFTSIQAYKLEFDDPVLSNY